MRRELGKDFKVHQALRAYGLESLDIDILREVRDIDGDDLAVVLAVLEIKYIREEGSIWPDGYNVSIGGEILGIPADYMNLHCIGGRAVLVYDSDGNLLKEYPSVIKCSYDLGIDEDDVRLQIGKRSIYHDKYVFREKRYGYAPERIDVSGFKVVQRVKYETVVEKRYVTREINIGQPVGAIVYDMNGDFCGEYPSKTKAARTFTMSHVEWGKYANGYIIYKKPEGEYPKKIEPYIETVGHILGEYYRPVSECPLEERNLEWEEQRKVYYTSRRGGPHKNLKNDFPVGQYSLNGDFIREYPTLRDASLETGVPYSGIWLCIKGTAKKAGGYRWSRMDGVTEKLPRYCSRKFLGSNDAV